MHVTTSWVIREKESKRVIAETFNPKAVALLNTLKYEAVPIGAYLGSINGNPKWDCKCGEPNCVYCSAKQPK